MPAPATEANYSRAVVAMLLAVFSSAAALAVGATALGKQVFDLTGRELDLGFLGLAEFAPSAVLVLVSGSLADRYDRRRVSAVGMLVEIVAAGLLFLVATSDRPALGAIFALVGLMGLGRAIVAPASRALTAEVVAPEHLSWLIPRRSVAWQSAVIGGPVLAGFLYAADPAAPYVAMAALLVVALVAILLVQVVVPARQPSPDPDEPPRGNWYQALEGLRFIRGQPVLLGAIGLDLAAVLFGGVVGLLPAIATERLGVDAVGLGWLRAAGGIGAAAVTLALARRPLTRRVGRWLLWVVGTFGATTVVLGLTTNFVVALVAMAVLSGADAISVFIRATLVPLVTPNHMRGRVLAVENVFIGGSNQVGDFESGVAGQVLGVGPAVVAGGAATLVVAGVWWHLFPGLRDVDRFPTGAETTPVGSPDGHP